jgi:5-(carboxyamino)imidazole ribonucleotide mutase
MSFVSIIMGSKSDVEVVQNCANTLERFGVKYEMIIASAHRTPKRTKEYVTDAEGRGAKVFICAAGMAAHLAGAVAATTIRPVLGIPLKGGAMDGLDSVLSTLQMPSAMPVGTLALGKAGAINSAYLAIQILALEDSSLYTKLIEDREEQERKVIADSESIEKRL